MMEHMNTQSYAAALEHITQLEVECDRLRAVCTRAAVRIDIANNTYAGWAETRQTINNIAAELKREGSRPSQ